MVTQFLLWAVVAAIGAAAVLVAIRLSWHAAGIYLIRRAGPAPLRAARHVIWRNPGNVAALDLEHGPGGPELEPVAPFTFVEEHLTGSQPCVSVQDARG